MLRSYLLKHVQHSFQIAARNFCQAKTLRKPTDIKLKTGEKALYITFDDGKTFRYPAEYLRVETPSAEARGLDGQRQLIAGKKNVGITSIEQVGNYALRIVFDDRHSTGIYSWSYLYELGSNKWNIMKNYVRRLRACNRSRDPKMNIQLIQQERQKLSQQPKG